MDKVLTIHDYYDGILMGVASMNGTPCIYESFRYEPEQTDSDWFHLTPISESTLELIMHNWEMLVQWGETHDSFDSWNSENDLDLAKLAKASESYRKYVRHGKFHGNFKLDSRIDNLKVVWTE